MISHCKTTRCLGLLCGLLVHVHFIQPADADALDSRMHLSQSHSFAKGDHVLIAVVDTGIDVNHPALKDALWVNPGESGRDPNGAPKEKNQIDDDSNGFIDDVNGWNFASNNNDLSDHHGHGTHIAGLIAAKRMAPYAFQGVAPNVKLMVLKYYDPVAAHHSNLESSTAAIQYAIKMHADIINFSSGGDSKSNDEEMVIREASRTDILIVAAAGNSGLNNDRHGFYPASYGLENLISVASLRNGADRLLTSSNFGPKTVDIAAPGEDLFSTLPGGRYGRMTGTSQATALVTGVAALYLSMHAEHPSAAFIKRQLMSVVDINDQLLNKTQSSGCVNALTSLTTLPEGQTASGAPIFSLQRLNRDLFTVRPAESAPLLKR